MNNVTYAAVQEIYDLGNERRTSYGIVAYSDESIDGTVTIIASVRDVSPDCSKMTKLAEQLNQAKLSPIHLRDVVEDQLAE